MLDILDHLFRIEFPVRMECDTKLMREKGTLARRSTVKMGAEQTHPRDEYPAGKGCEVKTGIDEKGINMHQHHPLYVHVFQFSVSHW